MRDTTREELCAVIEGRAEGMDISVPLLYDFWMIPKLFGDKEKEMLEFLERMPCAVECVHAIMPDGCPEEPEYTWGKRIDTGKKGADSTVIIEDWEDEEAVEKFYANFPDPEYPRLIPAEFSPKPGKYVLGHWWRTLFERHWAIRGMENALTDYYLYPEQVHRLFARLTAYYCRLIERLHDEAGCDGIFTSDDIGTQTGPFFSVEIFREFFKPYYKQMIDKAHSLGMHFWLHACGDIEAFLEDFIEIGLDVIHPIQRHTAMDSKPIAETYGSRICIFAGFDVQQTIPFGTLEEVRAEVRYLMDTYARPEGRLILTMGNGATPDWKPEAIKALYDESINYIPAQLRKNKEV